MTVNWLAPQWQLAGYVVSLVGFAKVSKSGMMDVWVRIDGVIGFVVAVDVCEMTQKEEVFRQTMYASHTRSGATSSSRIPAFCSAKPAERTVRASTSLRLGHHLARNPTLSDRHRKSGS